MDPTRYAADLAAVRAAAARIDGVARRTPLLRCASIDALAGRAVLLKAEHLQRTGSFKIRGAMAAASALPDGVRTVVTHSSGNFAQALAWAARARGVQARVVMPTNAPEAKRRATLDFGAVVVPCAPTLAAREAAAHAEVEASGGVLVHPFDDPAVIAGQGTLALELLGQAPDLDAIVAPVGGGGLVSGIALAARELGGIPVIAAEPRGADDAARSRAAGALLPQTAPDTIADGLRTSLGRWTWPVVRDVVRDVVVVDDAAIVAAMRLLWGRAKAVVEPSGAVALAAVLAQPDVLRGAKRVAVILSGGNVDLDRLPWR